jgi:hypothetical protein
MTIALMMEAVRTSETSLCCNETTRRNIKRSSSLQRKGMPKPIDILIYRGLVIHYWRDKFMCAGQGCKYFRVWPPTFIQLPENLLGYTKNPFYIKRYWKRNIFFNQYRRNFSHLDFVKNWDVYWCCGPKLWKQKRSNKSRKQYGLYEKENDALKGKPWSKLLHYNNKIPNVRFIQKYDLYMQLYIKFIKLYQIADKVQCNYRHYCI